MSKRVWIFLMGIGSFGLFVQFSYIIHKNLFKQIDFDTTVRLQDHIISRRFDGFFSFLSVLGSFEPMVIFLIAILLFRRNLWGVVTLVSFIGLHIVEIFGKSFVNHLPPPEFMLRTQQLVSFPQFHIREVFSYPSGHSARATFISLVVGYILFRSKKISYIHKLLCISVLLVYDCLMFLSRVYLGEHWTSDVIGGALLGISSGLVGIFAF